MSCRIADAMNTYKYALTIVRDKGYKIFFIPDPREEFFGDYWAVKDGRDFIGGDPLRLLGLIGIWERYGDDWYTGPEQPDSTLDDKILDRAMPDEVADFEKLSDEEFAAFVADYRVFFETMDLDEIKENITREEMFHLINELYQNEEE